MGENVALLVNFKASGFQLRWSAIDRHVRSNVVSTPTPVNKKYFI